MTLKDPANVRTGHRTHRRSRRRVLAGAGAALLALLLAPALVPAAASAATPAQSARTGLSLDFESLFSTRFVTASSFSPGTPVQSVTVQLDPGSVLTGDLYVAWVSQYNAPGVVQVADNVDGAWTRGPSTTFSDGGGDIALYYVQPRFAPHGVTVTISASAPTYLAGSVAQYRGLYLPRLETAQIASMPASANNTDADSGPTGYVGSGDLLFGSLITGGLPGPVTLGSSQGVPMTQRSTDDSNSAMAADVLSTRRGTQHAEFVLRPDVPGTNDWYVVAAVFHPLF